MHHVVLLVNLTSIGGHTSGLRCPLHLRGPCSLPDIFGQEKERDVMNILNECERTMYANLIPADTEHRSLVRMHCSSLRLQSLRVHFVNSNLGPKYISVSIPTSKGAIPRCSNFQQPETPQRKRMPTSSQSRRAGSRLRHVAALLLRYLQSPGLSQRLQSLLSIQIQHYRRAPS